MSKKSTSSIVIRQPKTDWREIPDQRTRFEKSIKQTLQKTNTCLWKHCERWGWKGLNPQIFFSRFFLKDRDRHMRPFTRSEIFELNSFTCFQQFSVTISFGKMYVLLRLFSTSMCQSEIEQISMPRQTQKSSSTKSCHHFFWNSRFKDQYLCQRHVLQ